VQEATANLLAEIKKERKEKADARIAEMKALLQRAAHDIPQAKKPEDLDNLIEAMGEHSGNRYGGGYAMTEDQSLNQQFSSAFEFAKQWQNYLSHLATGQVDLAHNDLLNLSNNDAGLGLIPRSKLLAMAGQPVPVSPAPGSTSPAAPTPLSQAQAILDDIKTLDDLEPARKKLEPLWHADMGDLQGSYQSLTQMEDAYRNLRAGLPASTAMNFGYPNGPLEVPAGVRAQLLNLAMQSRFETYKGPPAALDEKPADYVNRVVADAISREDWELLRRAESARQALTQNPGLTWGASATSVDSIVAGAHLEEAGQYALAVQSYEAALKTNDPDVPAKILGDKLAAIQRNHPKEYADGLEMTESPPAPRYYQPPPASFRAPLPPAITNSAATIPPTLLSPSGNPRTPASK
jgi:hypothetical protein